MSPPAKRRPAAKPSAAARARPRLVSATTRLHARRLQSQSEPAVTVQNPTSQRGFASSAETNRRGWRAENGGIAATASCSREYAQLTASADTNASPRPIEVRTGACSSIRSCPRELLRCGGGACDAVELDRENLPDHVR